MKVAIVGGSLGGLTAGLALKRLSQKMPTVISSVDIFEKVPSRLTDGGAGIVLQPEVTEALERYTSDGVDDGVQVLLERRQFVEKDGNYQTIRMPQPMTSWEAVWKRLRNSFPDENYHSGVKVTAVTEQSDGRIRLIHEGTNRVYNKDTGEVPEDCWYDMVIAADGAGSQIRSQFLPDLEPSYAGYVAYRGTLAVMDASAGIVDFF